jgi:hypothetical protein
MVESGGGRYLADARDLAHGQILEEGDDGLAIRLQSKLAVGLVDVAANLGQLSVGCNA